MSVQSEYDAFVQVVSLARQLRTAANGANPALPHSERHFFYESIFLRIFRAYENCVEAIFLCYAQNEPTLVGDAVESYLAPKDTVHARKLITSGMPFLDWTSPQTVIERAEVYLKTGAPIKTATTSNLELLQQAKKIRNHISHNSTESLVEYNKVVKSFLLTLPVAVPTPGDLLSMSPTKGPAKNTEILEYYINKFQLLAHALAH